MAVVLRSPPTSRSLVEDDLVSTDEQNGQPDIHVGFFFSTRERRFSIHRFRDPRDLFLFFIYFQGWGEIVFFLPSSGPP